MSQPTDLSLPEGTNIPKHIAIIPDGNRRWARARGFPPFEGHRRGFEITPEIARAARQMGVHTLTIWAFSTENWRRTKQEVAYLMKMYEWFIEQHLNECLRDEVKIVHLGRKDRIPGSLRLKIVNAEEQTAQFSRNILNVGLDYGGHDEILRAVEKILQDIRIGKVTAEKLKEVVGFYHDEYPYYYFKEYLDTHDQPYPYPDLVIRTSNEQRTSGLLPLQIVYAEYYWEKDHFPDFTPQKLRAAILDYSARSRRFGGEHKKVE